jgi:hypothetical protein
VLQLLRLSKRTKNHLNGNKEADRNFKLLKKKITEQPMLALPDFDKFFQVETDASGTAIGVV